MIGAAWRAGAVVLAIGTASPARADSVYYCVPEEPRTTAPDRLVSVEVTIKQNGEFASVIYRAANGATYDRGKQYEARNEGDESGPHYWVGTLRSNPNFGMVGSLSRRAGRLIYLETIQDNLQGGKVVSRVTSVCEPTVAKTTTPQAPGAPSFSLPNSEFDAFSKCVNAAVVALATISSEPAQTVVDAALGECPRERLALQNALDRQGIPNSLDFVDGLLKDVRPNLLALVLNTRAAARSSGGQAKDSRFDFSPSVGVCGKAPRQGERSAGRRNGHRVGLGGART